ncbi:uncharacterized protein LOC115348947 [Aquila chrysaetos chrysaetos]|uniref:uncharacterized protein LOC115348947 n=1 Tax=Aquila chrysaetos chrysaetos TaxID=223781 RepID=UPI0011764ED3|nr:uncharacterized protein LOC115348947 [Aquila chrysaetos chrysaetos]
MSVLDCSLILEKLKEYEASPTPPGVVWTHDNCHNPEVVASCITNLVKEQGLWSGKGKAIVCAVLGAALTAAQKDRDLTGQAEGETIRSLQDQVKVLRDQLAEERDVTKTVKSLQEQTEILQSQLAAERNTTQRLHAALSDALDRDKNQWEVNRVLVWQQEKWEEILNIAKWKSFLVGWIAVHQIGDHPAYLLNDQVDSLTLLARFTLEGEEEKWEHLIGMVACKTRPLREQRFVQRGSK